MAENSGISWTDATFNPWWGCTKVSPACDNCYAERDAGRFAAGRVLWGVNAERRTFGDKHWNEPRRWAKTLPTKLGRRPRVFCASMADVFDKNAPEGARERLWTLILETPQLDWLLLTKRIGNARAMLPPDWVNPRAFRWPANLRIGATFCNQEEVNRDMPKLLDLGCPNFASIEPILGPIDLTHVMRSSPDSDWTYCDNALTGFRAHKNGGWEGQRLEWVIVGGESGSQARPMHSAWVRTLRDQCAAAGVPFHFKQWGEYTAHEVDPDGAADHLSCIDLTGGECALSRGEKTCANGEPWWSLPPHPGRGTWGPDGIPPGVVEVRRVGKKAAGRLLDGVEHNAFPEAA